MVERTICDIFRGKLFLIVYPDIILTQLNVYFNVLSLKLNFSLSNVKYLKSQLSPYQIMNCFIIIFKTSDNYKQKNEISETQQLITSA